jgi:hypothetical protein
MLVKKSLIYKKLETHPYVQILSGKNLIFGNNEQTDINELTEFLENECESGIVTIKMDTRPKRTKGEGGDTSGLLTYTVRVGQENTAVAGQPHQPQHINFHPDMKTLYNENIELKQDNNNLKNQIPTKVVLDSLNEKIKKLEEGDILEKYSPLLMAFFGKGTGTAPAQATAIAGTESESKKEKIFKAVIKLGKIDANFADTITDLANFAEKSPEKYLSFLPMLKNL